MNSSRFSYPGLEAGDLVGRHVRWQGLTHHDAEGRRTDGGEVAGADGYAHPPHEMWVTVQSAHHLFDYAIGGDGKNHVAARQPEQFGVALVQPIDLMGRSRHPGDELLDPDPFVHHGLHAHIRSERGSKLNSACRVTTVSPSLSTVNG